MGNEGPTSLGWAVAPHGGLFSQRPHGTLGLRPVEQSRGWGHLCPPPPVWILAQVVSGERPRVTCLPARLLPSWVEIADRLPWSLMPCLFPCVSARCCHSVSSVSGKTPPPDTPVCRRGGISSGGQGAQGMQHS